MDTLAVRINRLVEELEAMRLAAMRMEEEMVRASRLAGDRTPIARWPGASVEPSIILAFTQSGQSLCGAPAEWHEEWEKSVRRLAAHSPLLDVMLSSYLTQAALVDRMLSENLQPAPVPFPCASREKS